MGICQSSETRRQLRNNDLINRRLQREKEREMKVIKLLLLGPGQCGKSTIIKQMTIIHKNGFSEEEYQDAKAAIYWNTTKSMGNILNAMKELEIRLSNSENEVHMEIILSAIENGTELQAWTDVMYNALKQLWSDQGVKACFERRNEYQLNDNVDYFLDSLDTIHQPGYKPSEQDILNNSVPTTGIRDVNFKFKGHNYRVYDVGGQRSERRKWIHCFENVRGVIFMAALSDYNLTLSEDNHTNRILETKLLFSSICNSKWFAQSSMILFLNKKDLFEKKIDKGISIKIAFPNYKGPTAYQESVDHVTEVFKNLYLQKEKKGIYTHETCATDTNQVQMVISSVIRYVTKENINLVKLD